MDLPNDNIFVSALFVIAVSVSGWALVEEVDLQARVKVLESQHADNDRRFNEMNEALKSINTKLDRLLGAK